MEFFQSALDEKIESVVYELAIEIVMKHEGDQLVVSRLGTGDFFGEIALLTDKVRMASVRASSELELLCIEREDLMELLEDHKELDQKLKAIIENRAKDTMEAYRSHQEMKRPNMITRIPPIILI